MATVAGGHVNPDRDTDTISNEIVEIEKSLLDLNQKMAELQMKLSEIDLIVLEKTKERKVYSIEIYSLRTQITSAKIKLDMAKMSSGKGETDYE